MLNRITYIILLVLSVCGISKAERTVGSWRPIFQGVEFARGMTDTPRLQKVNAIRIDLQNPNVSFYATPGNGTALGDTNRRTGSQFMNDSGVQVGINTHYYATSSALGWNADLCGVGVSQGVVVSAATSGFPNGQTLFITSGKVASFKKTYTGSNISGYWIGVESLQYILKNNVVYTYGDTSVEPRSAVGLSSNGRYMILLTIDGRQTGYSSGATFAEEAQWLKDFGAYCGLNLDGGGSTHLLISGASGTSIKLNSPSEDRAVGSHLGVFALPLPSAQRIYVYDDFELGCKTTFSNAPMSSGSTTGILKTSTANPTREDSFNGLWSDKLVIDDNSTVSGGWFVRFLSGSGSRSTNWPRPANGYVGFFAKTSTPGISITIAIDNTANVTADRGIFKSLPADGQWHLCEWNLDDNSQWLGWVNGDGIIDTADFTIDSIQLTGPDSDAVIYIDEITHCSDVSLRYLFSTPGDYEPDGDLDLMDFSNFANDWRKNIGIDPLSDMDEPKDGQVDFSDLSIFANNWLNGF
ncbi:MAG: phosphodiester glycosidase family protein [Phycisphaerales bacterium]